MTPKELIRVCMQALEPVLGAIDGAPDIGLLSWHDDGTNMTVATAAASKVLGEPTVQYARKLHENFVKACDSFIHEHEKPEGDLLFWVAAQGLRAMRPYLPPEVDFATCLLSHNAKQQDVGVFMFSMSDQELQMGPAYHLDKARRFHLALAHKIAELEEVVRRTHQAH